MLYQVVAQGCIDNLEWTVKELIKLGWKPIGDVSVSDGMLYQAMVKE